MNIHRSRWMMFVAVTVLLLLASALLQAQSFEATVVGTVKDAQGAAIAGATVTITEDATGRTQSTTTDGQGNYTLLQLRPAAYTITFEANGFRTYTQKNLVLETSQTARVTVTLQVGARTDRVEVIAEAPTISLDQSKKGETIVNKQVADLPLNGRDFTDLASLVAGVYPRPADDDQGQGLSSSGTRTDATNFTLDGVANRSDRNGSVGVNTSLDSIQEFNVSTSSFPAEFGKVAGAQITVVSKSGTNQLHGSLFDYVRSNLVDAQNYQGGASALRRQQFGGTLGGKIVANKTFYFGSYEGSREAKSETAEVNAPSADWLGRGASGIVGDFRNLLPLATIGANGKSECERLYGQKPYDPVKIEGSRYACHLGYNTSSGTSNFHEFPIPNVIPANMISPVALAMLKYVPAANIPYVAGSGTLEGYSADGLHDTNRNKFMFKLDNTLSSANTFYMRWARQSGTEYDPFPSSRNYYPHMGSFPRQRYDSVAFGDTHIFSPNTFNEFRFGWYNQHNGNRAQNQDQDYAAALGISGVTTDPYFMGFPQVRIDGYPEMGDRYNYPFVYEITNYQWADSLTMVRGKHTFKFGVDLTRSNYNEGGATYMRGDFRFRGRNSSYGAVTTPNPWAFADFLMGLPDATEREVTTVPTDLTGWPMGFFAQDDWKVSSRLTVNVGLRYEIFPPFTEAGDRLANFIPSTGEVAVSGDPNYPSSMLFTNWKNIQPRIGFAFRPFNDSKTVIRGGGGVFYSQEMYNVARQQLAQNPPFQKWELYGRDSSCPNPMTCTSALTFTNAWSPALQKQPPLYGMDPHGHTPQIIQYNLTVEHELVPDLTWEVGYVGSVGHFLGRRYDINQGMDPYWSCSMGTDPGTGEFVPTCSAKFARYPYPARVTATGSAQSLTYQTQDANSNYHALQTSLRRRSKHGLTMLVSYTFSKMIDTASSTNNSTTGTQKYPQNSWNPGAERALSDLNRKHQFTASINYELPLGRGKWLLSNATGLTNAIVGNWQMNVKSSVLSGRPFTPQYNSADFTSERPNIVSDPLQDIPAWDAFNPAAFKRPSEQAEAAYKWNYDNPTKPPVPLPAVYGSAGRNSLTGPGFFTIDMGMSKNFKLNQLHEGTRLQFRVEAFNLLNHPNFQVPNFLLDQPNVAQYRTMATDQRVFQFAMKVLF